MKSLGPIYIDNDERKIVRKRENGEAGRILVTLHNAREEEKIESFEIIKELVEEMAEEVDDIDEEKTIEYFQTAIPFITRNLTGYLLEQVDRRFNISQGITKRMAVVIRKYLIGTAKKYIGKGLKETLSNYVIDNALDTIEKIAIPDRVLEGYINDILQYILKQTNLVVRNFAELKEISKMETKEELIEFLEEIVEKEELEENWEMKIENWMNPESEEFDKERMQEFAEQMEEAIEIFNFLSPYKQNQRERYGIPEKLQFRKQEDNTYHQNVPLRISNEQGRLPRTFERGFVARGTYNDQEITPPTHRFSKITLGKQDETENEAPPVFTSEPKETEKRIEFNPITPQTTDDELESKKFYNKEGNRQRFSKKKYSRKDRKKKIQKQVEYKKEKPKEYTRRNPRQKPQIQRVVIPRSSTRATINPRIRITLGNRSNTIQRLYQSGNRGSTFTAIGRINNKDIRIYFSTERDFDLISNRSLARQIGGNNERLGAEDLTLIRDGLPTKISNNTDIIGKKSDDTVIVEFEYFILKLEKVFISGDNTTEDFITIGNRTAREHQMQLNFHKNQFSIPNPLYEPNPEKSRLYAKNIYDNTEFANNLDLSEIEYKTQGESELESEEEYYQIEMVEEKPKHNGKRFAIIVLKDGDGCWISERIDRNKPYYKKWQFPGGKVEEYETYKEGAIRELLEETGIKREKGELEFIVTDKYEGITCQIYMIRLYKEKPKLLEEGKMSEWRKIENKELKTYKMTPSIEKYKDIIIKELEKEEYFGTPPNF